MVALRIRQPLLALAATAYSDTLTAASLPIVGGDLTSSLSTGPVSYNDNLAPATIPIAGGELASTYSGSTAYSDTLAPGSLPIVGGNLSTNFVGTPANSDPSYAIQKAIVAALRVGVISDVYDIPPQRDPFPRITIGEGQVLGNFADCYSGSECFIQIDVWSRKPGFGEAKTLANQVRGILDDKTLALDGHTMEFMRFESSQILRDPDGLTSHIAMTFRILTQPQD